MLTKACATFIIKFTSFVYKVEKIKKLLINLGYFSKLKMFPDRESNPGRVGESHES